MKIFLIKALISLFTIFVFNGCDSTSNIFTKNMLENKIKKNYTEINDVNFSKLINPKKIDYLIHNTKHYFYLEKFGKNFSEKIYTINEYSYCTYKYVNEKWYIYNEDKKRCSKEETTEIISKVINKINNDLYDVLKKEESWK